MKYLYLFALLLLCSDSISASNFRFSSLQFDENGNPTVVTCVFRISSEKKIIPQGVILTNAAQGGFVTYFGPEPRLLRRTKDFYEIEASFDLSKTPDIFPRRALKLMRWKFVPIGSTIKNIKETGFIKIIEINGALVGFSLGNVNNDPEVLDWFQKSSPDPKSKGKTEPSPTSPAAP